MKISIIGLGYVGCVTAAGLAKLGHMVIGVEINPDKVKLFNSGKSPIVEKDLDELMQKGLADGTLSATTDLTAAISGTDATIVCVGTPVQDDGNIDLTFVKRVADSIGTLLKDKGAYHLVVFKSTMFPGTTEDVLVPILEKKSEKKAGEGFGVAYNPEFIRESFALKDFFNPSYTIAASNSTKDLAMVEQIYDSIPAPFISCTIKEAEMTKYADNAFHAVKVVYANEIGNICKALDIDSHAVMKILVQDTIMNISPYYLMPGFPYGGSCLVKDLSVLVYQANRLGLQPQMLNTLDSSNRKQVDVCVNMIAATGKKKIGVLGLSFKAGTDDIRNSPIITILNELLDQGAEISIYDRNVYSSHKFGVMKHLAESMPKITGALAPDMEHVVRNADVVVIATKEPEFKKVKELVGKNTTVIDFVRMFDSKDFPDGNYTGLCW